MISKDISRPEAQIEAGRLSARCTERSSSMRKLRLAEEYSRKVLNDDERTRESSSHSSARASKTQELVKKTINDAIHLKKAFEYGERSTE